jgi:signal transduction histidine kinase
MEISANSGQLAQSSVILIVDDKKENLFSLKTLLELNRFETDTAASGEEALKKILKNEYALIILDVQMPGMDGYEVAETVTGYSKTKNIPIIFLSAVNIDKGFISKGYASGGVDYITKPFDPDLLLLKVKTFCRLYDQNRQLSIIQTALKEEIEIRKAAERALQNANFVLEDKVKERTSDLLQMNKALEGSNAELQQYASVASHDLQEPLRKIIMFSYLIREKFIVNTPEAQQYINKIILSTERMRNLINDLLNYSKLSATTHFTETDLNEILQDTLNDLDLSIKEKNAELNIRDLPAIEAIPGQMRQMFQNIISNALKFSKKEVTPVITIWCESSKEEDVHQVENRESVTIFIRDNGIGFNEKYRDKIFTLFQRLHAKDQFEGTGIGLAIVKKIIEKHNGYLSVKSREGEGTTFAIVLPMRQTAILQTELRDKY